VLRASEIPNDPEFARQYHLENSGQDSGTAGADIRAPQGWNRQKSARKVVVGIIDSGIDYLHPDLAANVWSNPGEIPDNGIDDDGNGYIDDIHGWDFVSGDNDPMDDNRHGTHVAGIIAASANNGLGVAGVAWEAQLMAIKFMDATGNGKTSDAINAINYARAMGVKLINTSWGYWHFNQALFDAVANCGALDVAAAGNAVANLEQMGYYPATFNLDNVLSVAATDRFGGLASFSNYGATAVDLAAPGSAIFSTTPREATADMLQAGVPTMYATMSGTSMATPVVTGIAALVLQRNGSLSPVELKRILMNSVDVLPSLQGKCVTAGQVNLDKALALTPASWLTVSPASITLAPGQSQNLVVRASVAGMAGGSWQGQVVLKAPGMADKSVAVAMNVASCVTLSGPSSLDFGITLAGAPARKSMRLSNTCNSPLEISGITSDNAAYTTVSALPLRIAPYSSADVGVQLLSHAEGFQFATLMVRSNAQNAPNLAIPVSGRVILPPRMVVSPAQISGTAAQGSQTTVTLTLRNTGTANLTAKLTYATANGLPWLGVNPANVTVPAGAGVDIPVTLNAGPVAGGTHSGEIRIAHNDPAVPSPFTVPVTFTVSGTKTLVAVPAALSFRPQGSDRNFAFTQRIVNATFTDANVVKGADMDGDGDIDLVVANNVFSGKPTLAWIENPNNHALSWKTHIVMEKPTSARQNYEDLDLVDLDRDGDMDIVAAVGSYSNASFLGWFENTPGGFVERIVTTKVDNAGYIKAVDMDRDGDIDLVSATRGDGKITWWQNDGRQAFTDRVISTQTIYASDLDVGDMDSDGDIDVVAASFSNGEVAWYRNDGAGAFTKVLLARLGDVIKSKIIDTDGDGDLDVLSAGQSSACMLYVNRGGGVFEPRTLIGGGQNVWFYSVNAADMDNDGDKDLLLRTGSGGTYSTYWYENDGRQNYGAGRLATRGADRGLWPADFDGDGDLDLACATYLNGSQIPGPAVYIAESAFATNSAYTQLVNNGSAPTTITALASNSDRFRITAKLPLVVPPRDSVSVNVAFVEGSGPSTGTLTVVSDAVDNPTLNVQLGNSQSGISLPGRIEVENYKTGGPGQGYYDLTAGNIGGAYRTDDVDIEATTDMGGGFDVGWTQAGEWLAYDVNVVQAGTYTLTARLASGAAGTKTMTMSVDGMNVATFNFTDAAGWQSWRDVAVPGVNLAAGPHVVRLTMNTGDFNVNYVQVAVESNAGLIQNGSFANNLSGWQTQISGGAAGDFSLDAGSAKAVVAAAGANPWDFQIYQVVALTAGKTYTLDFDLKAEATPKSFKVVVEHNSDPWTKYHAQSYPVTATANVWQHYTITWTQPVSDNSVRVGFHFGADNVNDAWLDNVTLK
ncbi:MAG TPA: S8 family serine peptidase, partial [Fibrobacteria bacterium]|nr:S8 family serine peptidase [Fibrobacteria bacterium]